MYACMSSNSVFMLFQLRTYFFILQNTLILTHNPHAVPILPDYLATINNRAHHTPFDMFKSHNYTNDGANVGIASPFMAPPSLTHRYIDGVHQPIQTFMTKHPIPGKSMVNFTLPNGDGKATSLSAEHKQLRYTNEGTEGGTIAGTLTKSSSTGNTIGPGDKTVEKEFDEASLNEDPAHIAANPAATTVTDSNNSKDTKAHKDSNESLTSENSSIGILLSMKALVQLIFNPIVGNLTAKFGYRLPIVAGTFLLLLSSLGMCEYFYFNFDCKNKDFVLHFRVKCSLWVRHT